HGKEIRRFEPERDVPPGALSNSIRTKSLNPDFRSRHAAVSPATPPPTITTGTLDHASGGTSTRTPSRTRCPKTSDAPTISPSGSGVSSLRRHAESANGTPKNAAKSSRLFIAEQPQKSTKHTKKILGYNFCAFLWLPPCAFLWLHSNRFHSPSYYRTSAWLS